MPFDGCGADSFLPFSRERVAHCHLFLAAGVVCTRDCDLCSQMMKKTSNARGVLRARNDTAVVGEIGRGGRCVECRRRHC